MAIEWNSRVNRAITLREAMALAGNRLAELIGWPDARGRVVAREATATRRRGGVSAPIENDVLDRLIDPFVAEPPQPDVYFEVLEWEAAVLVSLSQYQARSDDPETGLFAWVTAERAPMSKVLAIAATLALAECGGGEVIDEYGYLSDERLNPPVELPERLRVPAPSVSPDAGVDTLLARTRLGRGPAIDGG